MKYLIQEGYVKPGSFTAKLIGLSLAFTLSGFLHWAAMFTAIGDTLPLYELIFFILQGVGIVLQDSVCKLFSPIIIKLPSSIRQMGNLFYTLAWFYLTGWIEADNMARSGINLVPLVPFSPMTALGFGEHDANWKSWESVTSMWFSGKNWWESGYFAC
ncbi:hypothetical protein EV44_g1873 [Erysiphe necator]|uniref:Wax synthase domain-containing protein n=1 Tax=Uncinula necator TaxID=52586 RepID=A0A0B1PDS8_UNCNE|nr:hypothetical protein EV44_g1873 [Erysiphe necator]